MTRAWIVALFLFLMLLFGLSVSLGWGRAFDVSDERTIEGTVASKGHEIEGLMYFPLKVGNGVIEVQIGPKEFVERSGFKPKIGEMVTVIGVPAIVAEREVLLAREVRSKSAVFIVRDRNGEPMWDPNRPILWDPKDVNPPTPNRAWSSRHC